MVRPGLLKKSPLAVEIAQATDWSDRRADSLSTFRLLHMRGSLGGHGDGCYRKRFVAPRHLAGRRPSFFSVQANLVFQR